MSTASQGNSPHLNRREALAALTAGGLIAAGALGANSAIAATEPQYYPLKRAVKYGMIVMPGATVEQKFAAIKPLGLLGVEINGTDPTDPDEFRRATDKTGVEVHGVVCGDLWKDRLSDPDPAVQAKGRALLEQGLRLAQKVGATTALCVPGKVSNLKTENYDQVYERSQANIRKVIPVAHETGVKIAVEVVWNNFITKPVEFCTYIDEFNDPMVGAYMDSSNMLKYGCPTATWIRKLGKRMLKIDCKGWKWNDNPAKGWVALGEGDENWPEIVKALQEVGYNKWLTAEVDGGNVEYLKQVSETLHNCLKMSS